ncbi:unnamed protein product [Aspergillus oryzae]|nr:unnamed protein product [Aspergillus oryzae]GMF94529.1 unnamed protein product [Aspergillus oryzae]
MSLVQRQDIELRGQLVATSQHWLDLVTKIIHKVTNPVTATYLRGSLTLEPIMESGTSIPVVSTKGLV